MEQEILKKLQATEIGILEAVTNLCEKHGITYFLDSGTLIGAIRHDGFIPWDDDVDITMPYKDYLRFLKIAQKELGDAYFVQNHETEDNFFRSYTKVSLNGTTVYPRLWKYWDIHHGAWIDIFPLFYADNDKEINKKRKLYRLCIILQKKNFYRNLLLQNEKKTIKSSIAYALYCLLGIIPVKARKKLHTRLLNHICAKEDGRYLCRCALIIRRFDKASYMGPVLYHPFEHLSLRVPSDYDKVLRDEYGDYMQLPPENKRGNHGELITSF